MFLAGHAAYLKHIDEIGVEQDFHRKVHRRQVKVLEGHAVEKNLRREQLFAANVDRVLWQVKGIAQRDVAGSQLDLRGERLLCRRRKHHSAVPANPQLQVD